MPKDFLCNSAFVQQQGNSPHFVEKYCLRYSPFTNYREKFRDDKASDQS